VRSIPQKNSRARGCWKANRRHGEGRGEEKNRIKFVVHKRAKWFYGVQGQELVCKKQLFAPRQKVPGYQNGLFEEILFNNILGNLKSTRVDRPHPGRQKPIKDLGGFYLIN
jgi:hypothetical protein